MAKYLVTNGSNFQPFTYEELSRPLYEMAEAKRASQDQYDALSMQTEALRNYISENPGDDLVRQKYNAYVSQLNELQNNLWEHGYTPSTRRNLSLARNGFFSDIRRIGKAIENRQKRSLEFREAKKKDASLITSSDPGLDGLDEYFMDDLHGSDWYSYSGAQFMKEVGIDAKARAQELLNGIDVKKIPGMEGWLTQIITNGATSEQVGKAGQIVADALEQGLSTVPVDESTPEGMLANVLMSHINSTGARDRVSKEELNKLYDYGMHGLSQSIGNPQIQNIRDEVWAANQEYANWYRKESQKRRWAKQDAEEKARNLAAQQGKINDYWEYDYRGPGFEKAKEEFKYYENNHTVTIPGNKNHGEIRNAVDAAKVVFSDNIRRDNELHMDVGRTATGKLGSDSFVKGWVIGKDGQRHEIVYNPRAICDGQRGAITTLDGKVNAYRTRQYRQLRRQYEENLEYYKNNEKDVYKLASQIGDPDKQYRDYKNQNVDYSVPIEKFYDTVFTKQENQAGGVRPVYIARSGSGDKLLDVFASYLHLNMPEGKDPNRRSRNGSTFGIHEIGNNGLINYKTVKTPSEVITYNEKTGKHNIEAIGVSQDGILNASGRQQRPGSGYLIFRVRQADGLHDYAIGVDELSSGGLSNGFKKFAQEMINEMEKEQTGEGKWMAAQAVTSNVASDLATLLGQMLQTKVASQSGEEKI